MTDKSGMSESPLKERVSLRLLELGINAFEASRRGDLGREFVNDILKGRKKTVRGDNLSKLASALEVDPAYLLKTSSVDRHLSSYPLIVDDVPIKGVASEGIWIDLSVYEVLVLNNLQQIPHDQRYPREHQIDYVVDQDLSSDGISRGSFARCIIAEQWAASYPAPNYFVVEKYQNGLIERTIRRKPRNGESLIFVIDGGNTANDILERAIFPFDQGGDTPQKTVAVVLYTYLPLTQAR